MNNEITLILPVELSERRKVLEKELAKVVTELCFTGLRDEINKVFEEYNIEPKPTKIKWDFCGEYDDEGGTTYYPNNIAVYTNGEKVEIDNYTINKKSKWSDSYYDYELGEELHEVICDYRHDLYEHDIEEIDL
ncbi:hypothetical protein [Paenibacillus naphthalenovorans]|uniref:Uncharacterized protein n=1 Tax=Paenibacillus naphthalenovorans TaxID=162209 RepID=A0A0U2W9T4_9BACL|nr:hypothetical protein [Paenibacillus naphthalenovorans]ALS22122.1 hypothetical protein IJ22_17480 [Paenibacillus naphthalenovorans]